MGKRKEKKKMQSCQLSEFISDSWSLLLIEAQAPGHTKHCIPQLAQC